MIRVKIELPTMVHQKVKSQTAEKETCLALTHLGSILQIVKGSEWPANDPDNFATTFMGFTAKNQLDLYMRDALKNDLPTREDNRQPVLDDAFRCTTSIGLNEKHMNTSIEGQRLKLIIFLLDKGADPNDVAP